MTDKIVLVDAGMEQEVVDRTSFLVDERLSRRPGNRLVRGREGKNGKRESVYDSLMDFCYDASGLVGYDLAFV